MKLLFRIFACLAVAAFSAAGQGFPQIGSLPNLTAYGLGVSLMTNGADIYSQMKNATSDYQYQMGVSGYGGVGNPTLWFSNGKGTGESVWKNEVYIPGGIAEIGNSYYMQAGASSSTKVYHNGNPTDSRFANKGTRLSAYFYTYNLNPYGDGNGFCAPMVSTNAGTPILTNSDGTVIYIKNDFGNQLLSIPSEYFVGETNQAGSYVWLTQPDFPTYASCNITVPTEAGNFYSQHAWLAFDPAHTVCGFPMMVPNVWALTNALWRWAQKVDLLTGVSAFGSNVYVSGFFQATNGAGGNYIGYPQAVDHQVGAALTLVGTNASWQVAPSQDGAITFDVANSHRLGFLSKSGRYTWLATASAAPFTVGNSSDSDLLNNVNGQNVTPRLQISASDQSLTESSATVVINITLASGKSLAAHIFATTRADDGTNFQEDGDNFIVAAVNKGGTVTASISTPVNTSAVSSGTLTTTWTAVANGNSVDIKCNAVSSLTQTTLKTKFRVDLDSTDATSAITPIN